MEIPLRHQSSLDWSCQLKIAEQGSEAWVSSWIIFPMSEYGRYGGPMRYYSGRCVALIIFTCWKYGYLPQKHWGVFSDSTLRICYSGIHSSQSRMVSDWCSCIIFTCWKYGYLPQKHWGVFSDSTLRICSSGIHSSQSRMVSDWCSCILLRAGCNRAWQTDLSK